MLKIILAATAAAALTGAPAIAGNFYDYSGSHVGDLAGGKSRMPGTMHRMTTGGYDYSGSHVGDMAGGKSAEKGKVYRPARGYDYSGSHVGDLAGGKQAYHGTKYYHMPDGSWSTRPPATASR